VSEQVVIPNQLSNAEIITGERVRVEPFLMKHPLCGIVVAVDSPGLTIGAMAAGDGGAEHVSVLVADQGSDGEPGLAMFCLLDAQQARAIAASIMRMAERIDGGAGVQ
jgi:hypothetical protein